MGEIGGTEFEQESSNQPTNQNRSSGNSPKQLADMNVNLQTEQHEENVKETSYTVASLEGDRGGEEDGFAR
jgi:hypothetical protein